MSLESASKEIWKKIDDGSNLIADIVTAILTQMY